MKYIYLFTFLLSFKLTSATVKYSSSYVDVVNQKINKNYSITIEGNQIISIDDISTRENISFVMKDGKVVLVD